MILAKKCPAHHRSKMVNAVRDLYTKLEKLGYHDRCDFFIASRLGTADQENLWQFKSQVRCQSACLPLLVLLPQRLGVLMDGECSPDAHARGIGWCIRANPQAIQWQPNAGTLQA